MSVKMPINGWKMHSIELKMRTNDGKICYTLYMLRE